MEIENKLEKIRKIVGGTVIFNIGMKEPKKFDILGMSVCQESQYKDDFKLDESPDYTG